MFVCGCDSRAVAPPREAVKAVVLQVGTGITGGGFWAFGQALEPELNARLSGVSVRMEQSRGAVDNLLTVARGERACGFTYADVAYEAFADGRLSPLAVPMADVSAVAVLQITPVQLVARSGSGITTVSDLRGKRAAAGGPGTATSLIAQLLLEGHGIAGQVETAPVPLNEVPQRFAAGTLDAVFDTATYSDAIAAAVADGAVLVPIDGQSVNRLRERRPFTRAVLIPAGTYGPQQAAVATVGMESVLVCRRDVEDAVVQRVTEALVEALQVLAPSGRWNLVALHEMPTPPIPLHPGAAVFYRETELLR